MKTKHKEIFTNSLLLFWSPLLTNGDLWCNIGRQISLQKIHILSHSLVRSYQYWCKDWLTEDSEITQQGVWLELLKEEATEKSVNRDATPQKMTLTGYITTSLNIEHRQYVNGVNNN